MGLYWLQWCVKGYPIHIMKEELQHERERTNPKDSHTMDVVYENVVAGHLL